MLYKLVWVVVGEGARVALYPFLPALQLQQKHPGPLKTSHL